MCVQKFHNKSLNLSTVKKKRKKNQIKYRQNITYKINKLQWYAFVFSHLRLLTVKHGIQIGQYFWIFTKLPHFTSQNLNINPAKKRLLFFII